MTVFFVSFCNLYIYPHNIVSQSWGAALKVLFIGPVTFKQKRRSIPPHLIITARQKWGRKTVTNFLQIHYITLWVDFSVIFDKMGNPRWIFSKMHNFPLCVLIPGCGEEAFMGIGAKKRQAEPLTIAKEKNIWEKKLLGSSNPQPPWKLS